jgi:integrase
VRRRGLKCRNHFFKEETNNSGEKTGRIEYNPIFSKTTQGGGRKLADSKWLVKNERDHRFCPVKTFVNLQEKRMNITNTRLFLTPNPHWKISGNWFKKGPVDVNEISAWTKRQAEKSGLNTDKKNTNHSLRATAVSKLVKSGVSEQNLIKITGHSNAKPICSYLQIDEDHHRKIIEKIRERETEVTPQQIRHL